GTIVTWSSKIEKATGLARAPAGIVSDVPASVPPVTVTEPPSGPIVPVTTGEGDDESSSLQPASTNGSIARPPTISASDRMERPIVAAGHGPTTIVGESVRFMEPAPVGGAAATRPEPGDVSRRRIRPPRLSPMRLSILYALSAFVVVP